MNVIIISYSNNHFQWVSVHLKEPNDDFWKLLWPALLAYSIFCQHMLITQN